MSNLHTPTVPSGPTSRAVTNGHAARMSYPELLRRKEDLEAELKALGAVLDSHGVNMDTPLLTRDGFPRADIDVAQSTYQQTSKPTMYLWLLTCRVTSSYNKSSHHRSTQRLQGAHGGS